MMLTSDSVNQRHGIEQHLELEQKRGLEKELHNLESVIANLLSIQKSEDKKNQKHGNRSFGIQKLRLRRMNKKRVVSRGVVETKEDVMERVEKLHGICKDLSERLRAENDKHNGDDTFSAAKSQKLESRDDADEILSKNRENDEVERVPGDRSEILQAIKDCADVLSKFTVDRKISDQSIKIVERSIEGIEMTESKFLESEFNPGSRKELTEKAEKRVDGIEITENPFKENDADGLKLNKSTENLDTNRDEIELTESKFLETNAEMEKLNQSTESTNASTCYDIDHCKIIGAIENLLTCLVLDEKSGDEKEAFRESTDDEKDADRESTEDEKDATRESTEDEEDATRECTEDEAAKDYFCGMSQLWNVEQDEKVSLEENSISTENGATMNSVTTTECQTSLKDHLKIPIKCSTESRQIETVCSATPKAQTLCAEENEIRKKSKKRSESIDENSGNEEKVTASLNCGFVDSLCPLTSKNTDEIETVNTGDTEDEDDGESSDSNFLNSLDSSWVSKAAKISKKKNLEEKSKQSTKPHNLADINEKNQNDLIVSKVSAQNVASLETAKQNCMTVVTSVNDIRECVFFGNQTSDCSENKLAECVTFSKENLIESPSEQEHARDDEGMNEQVKDQNSDRMINTVSSMDFIPRIEVVGFKKSEKQEYSEGTSSHKISGKADDTEKEESTEKIDQREIASVSTMDFIPRFEVVGLKISEKSKPDKSTDICEDRDVSEQRQGEEQTAAREGEVVTKKWRMLSSKKSETKKKMSQKEYRRMTSKKRRKKRRAKHLSKQNHNSNALRLGTIQEAPDHLEQASNDSIKAAEKIKTRVNESYRETHEPLVRKTIEELPPPVVGQDHHAVVQDQAIREIPNNPPKDLPRKDDKIPIKNLAPADNLKLEILPQKNDKVPKDIHNIRSKPQPKEGAHDSTSQFHSSEYQQALNNELALLETVTSSLSTWTANKSALKEVTIKESEERDDDTDLQEKKPWFFQRREEEEHDQIVESLTAVLSIPTPSTFGTRHEDGDNEDDEYVNHYYDFGEDDCAKDCSYEQADDYNYEYEYEYDYDIYNEEEREEDNDDDCYVYDNY